MEEWRLKQVIRKIKKMPNLAIQTDRGHADYM